MAGGADAGGVALTVNAVGGQTIGAVDAAAVSAMANAVNPAVPIAVSFARPEVTVFPLPQPQAKGLGKGLPPLPKASTWLARAVAEVQGGPPGGFHWVEVEVTNAAVRVLIS